MKNIYLIALCGFFICLPAGVFAADEISITEKISRATVAVGEMFTVDVTATWPAEDASYIIKEVTAPQSGSVEVITSSQEGRAAVSGGETVAQNEFHYRMRATTGGKAVLSPFTIELASADGSTVLKKGNELTLDIVSPVKRYSGRALLALVFTGVIGAVYYVGRRVAAARRSRTRQEVEAADTQTTRAAIVAIQNEILALKKHFVSGNDGLYFKGVREQLLRFASSVYQRPVREDSFENDLAACTGSEAVCELFAQVTRQYEDSMFAGHRLNTAEREVIVKRIEHFMEEQTRES